MSVWRRSRERVNSHGDDAPHGAFDPEPLPFCPGAPGTRSSLSPGCCKNNASLFPDCLLKMISSYSVEEAGVF